MTRRNANSYVARSASKNERDYAFSSTTSNMRFNSINKPTAAPSWRIILWMVTLMPMMLMASWFARRSQLSRPANGVSELTKEDARRLDRILHSADEPPNVISVGKSVRDLNSSHGTTDIVRPQEKGVGLDPASGEALAAGGTALPTASASPLTTQESSNKEALASVSDNTFGIPNVERATYEALLIQVRGADQADLERTAHREVPFAVLMLEPNRFRGELITIEGDLRRLNGIPTTRTDTTESDSYEAWIFTADSGLNPYRVVCTSLPTGLAFGDQLTPPIRVRVTGYFFKRYSYATTGNYHTAPLLLAKTLVPMKKSTHKNVAAVRLYSREWLMIALGITVLLVAAGLAVTGRTQRRHRKSGLTFDNADSEAIRKDIP